MLRYCVAFRMFFTPGNDRFSLDELMIRNEGNALIDDQRQLHGLELFESLASLDEILASLSSNEQHIHFILISLLAPTSLGLTILSPSILLVLLLQLSLHETFDHPWMFLLT